MKTDRRTFVMLGAGAGLSTALGLLPELAVAGDGCSAPYPPGTPIAAWKPSGGKVIPRLSAHALSLGQIAQLRKAYAIMAGLPASDPRSLDAQRNLHAWYCHSCANVPAPDIHGHWTFFPWHRAFLYFHERILGSLVGDPNLRLAYWGWENAARFALPPEYAALNNPLYDGKRFLKAGQSVERSVGTIQPYNLALVRSLVGGAFAAFAGTAGSAGNIEFGSHGFVHISTGGLAGYDPIPHDGDMADLNTAARDPIFYAHHGNIDRLWYSWQKVPGHTDPTGAFRALQFTFYDPAQKWVSIKCADMIATANLAYTYDAIVSPFVTPVIKNVPLMLERGGIVLPPSPESRRSVAAASSATLNLTGLQIEGDGVFDVQVKSAGAVHVLGRIFVTPHEMNRRMIQARRANLQLPISGTQVMALAAPGAELRLERVRPPHATSAFLLLPLSMPAPARAESVSVSIHH